MMKSLLYILFFSLATACFSIAQTTTIVLLDSTEQNNLRLVLSENKLAMEHYDSIRNLANAALKKFPQPNEKLFYEGLLNNNPKRIETKKRLEDMDAVVNLIYASYGSQEAKYAKKAAEFVISWAKTYQPTGNPINENKFVALYWAYYLFNDHFTKSEKQLIQTWLREIATTELERERTPDNNWQAKHLKIIGIIGCILNDQPLKQFAIEGFKSYINTSYFADGTSKDLRERDALSYHLSGINPTLSVFINLSKFDPEFDWFEYVGTNGGSIKKSVEYAMPFATGKKQRKEWINTTVQLDKERAAAGLSEYQPGKLFDPENAKLTFEWACYFKRDWYGIIGEKDNYASTWVGLLNSPLIRSK